MPRIAESVLEALKQTISLQRLAEARGVELNRHGADLIGRCPFHDDKTPSLVITPAKNLWHCLGACNAGGTVIDWVMRAEGVSFRHAVELLQNQHLPSAAGCAGAQDPTHSGAPVQPAVKRSTVKKLAMPIERDAEDAKVLAQVVDYYHQTLLQSPAALDYLQRRGLRSEEMIRAFKLGYANRTLGYRLPEKNRADGEVMRTRLQTLGILRDSGHEHFNGSIVIPIHDERGQVVQLYGRKLLDNLRAGTPKHLYLPGPHRGVWNAAALSSAAHGTGKEIILCEALIDALTFWCAGYRHVTTSYGVNGFIDEHLTAFKQHGVERVLIAYDRKDADGKIVGGQLTYSTEAPWRMALAVSGVMDLQCEERDLFDCMVVLRRRLQDRSWMLLCNGARKDVYPSGMSREMSGGLIAYRHQDGRKPTRDDALNIVEYAAPELVGTIDEQQQHLAWWLQSQR